MFSFSVVLIIDSSTDNLDKIFELINKNKNKDFYLEFILVDISLRSCTEIDWHNYPSLAYIHYRNIQISELILIVTNQVSSEWIFLGDLATTFPDKIFERYYDYLVQIQDKSLALLASVNDFSSVFAGNSSFSSDCYDSPVFIKQLGINIQQCYACLFKRCLLIRLDVDFVSIKDSDSAFSVLMAHYLLDYRDKKIGLVEGSAEANLNKDGLLFPVKWTKNETYGLILKKGYLPLLQKAASSGQEIPLWLQRTVMLDLLRYFETDSSEHAPTVIVTEPMADIFHELVSKIMCHISIATIDTFMPPFVSVESVQALVSYICTDVHSSVMVAAYDHNKELICLRYYFHGSQPKENIYLDNQLVEPVHDKYRACRFYRRKLFGERILWLAPRDGNKLTILLDGNPVPISSKKDSSLLFSNNLLQSNVKPLLVRDVPSDFGRGMHGQRVIPFSFKGFKVRLVRSISRILTMFGFFKNIWIFIDRENEADDNAEHMYRWVRINYPERNIFFFLDRSSCHWKRLKKEGFRVISSNFLQKLMFLNSQCVISSQAEYLHGGLNVELYGDLMRWRFVNLKHGVLQNDQSHWLNNMEIDLTTVSCPAEYDAFVGDDTPYTFTTKEVCLTGLARYDSLLALSGEIPPVKIDTVLVMPTWRGSLTDNRGSHVGQIHERIAESDYIKAWRTFLCSEKLSSLMNVYNKKLVFMPHHNMLPYLELFDLPDYIQVVTKNEISIQKLFCRTAIMVTDYSSVAFEIAYLKRAVVYFQFDRDKFYGGDHNWREGYFDYDKDGFGPVAKSGEELISSLKKILQNGSLPIYEYQKKMEKAFLCRDGQCCNRVYESIIDMFKTYE